MMKNHFLIYIIFALLLASCKQKTEPNICLNNTYKPSAFMVVVQFPSTDYLNYVAAAQHVYLGRSPITYENDDSTSLFLYRVNFPEKYISWAQQEASIVGTSPYIPLADGYYLIDWKWHYFHPVTYNVEAWPYKEYAIIAWLHRDRTFLTNIEWTKLKSLADTFDITHCSRTFADVKVTTVTYEKIDIMYHEDNRKFPYPYGGSFFYADGLSIYTPFVYNDRYNNANTVAASQLSQSYIHFCDSLQTVYQHRLIEIINNGELLKIGYQCQRND